MTKKTETLTKAQQEVIELLLAGKDDKEAAEAAGVEWSTVNEWRNTNLLFNVELNRRRRALWESQVERLRGLLALAVDSLESDLKSEDPEIRHKAAVAMLKMLGNEILAPAGPMTIEQAEFDKLLSYKMG